MSVIEHPFTGTTNRYALLKTSAREGNETKDWLVNRGFLTPVTIPFTKKPMLLFELTEKAITFLESKGIQVKQPANEGGIEHRFGVWWVKKHYENQGYSVSTEVKTQQGKFIDMVATKEGKKIAVLVETGKSDIESNIKAAQEAGYSDIKIIATNKDVLKKKFTVPITYLPELQKENGGLSP